jgi:hypothetical protein
LEFSRSPTCLCMCWYVSQTMRTEKCPWSGDYEISGAPVLAREVSLEGRISVV